MANTYNTADKQTKKLAHGLFKAISWGQWHTDSAATAMSWVERLRAANPQTAEDFAAALVNFDWMREQARVAYRNGNANNNRRIDRGFALWMESSQ